MLMSPLSSPSAQSARVQSGHGRGRGGGPCLILLSRCDRPGEKQPQEEEHGDTRGIAAAAHEPPLAFREEHDAHEYGELDRAQYDRQQSTHPSCPRRQRRSKPERGFHSGSPCSRFGSCRHGSPSPSPWHDAARGSPRILTEGLRWGSHVASKIVEKRGLV